LLSIDVVGAIKVTCSKVVLWPSVF